jgi:hypothetical protein
MPHRWSRVGKIDFWNQFQKMRPGLPAPSAAVIVLMLQPQIGACFVFRSGSAERLPHLIADSSETNNIARSSPGQHDRDQRRKSDQQDIGAGHRRCIFRLSQKISGSVVANLGGMVLEKNREADPNNPRRSSH